MALILSIETATEACSLALMRDANVLAEVHLQISKAHATQLAPLIQTIMQATGTAWKQLDAVAVSMGPGSYTGLRIGVSTAKGLCFAHDLPLIGVNTLEAMAQRVPVFAQEGDLVLSVVDARRDEVFAAVWQKTAGTWQPYRETSSKLVTELADWIQPDASQTLWLIGDAVKKTFAALVTSVNCLLNVCEAPIFHISAVGVGQVAWRRFSTQTFDALDTFEPYYYKAFEAKKNSRSLADRVPKTKSASV